MSSSINALVILASALAVVKYKFDPSVILPESNSVKSIAMSFELAIMPVPPITFSVTLPDVPPPVIPAPAITPVISAFVEIVIVLPLWVTSMFVPPSILTTSALLTVWLPAVSVVNFQLL